MNTWSQYIQRSNIRLQAPKVQLEKAKNGEWTAAVQENQAPPFFLHSRYEPTSEAERFAEAQLRNMGKEESDRIILYGAGCGHHVKALLKQTKSVNVSIEVWETNVSAFLQMERAGVYAEILENTRLRFVVSEDLHVFSERVKSWQVHQIHVIVHEPSLRAMPKELASLKHVLQEYQVHQNSSIAHSDLLQDNFKRNSRKAWPSVSAFRDFPPVPVILISAGPSLTNSLPLLPIVAKHCLLGAVGTALPILFRHGIQPDFVVMTDPQPGMLRQLEGWENSNVPLFFLSTLYSEVVERYCGPKFILFQEGFTPSEKEALLRGEPLVHTGGSVSTTLFSLARLLGLHPLCLIGQDLAYTNDQTHAEGTPLFQRWKHQAKGERVIAFDMQGTVVAPRNLLIYKKWFEEQARNSSETFYNATEGGAYIDGFTHLSLSDFLTKVQNIDVSEVREAFHRRARLTSM
ncbi:motility associated factor glycosyltransferase family protein [Brevibacillus sp. H7]|uniref:motility associated factor glycosyltransferase family protein n=1 Tax=Brevibacillus sp. H7 TaxID=3349138 RepID=UPI00380014F4